MRGLSPAAASGGHSSSRCAGLSLSRPLLLRSTGSRRAGSAIMAHGPSCSAACGIFPDQGSNPCPPALAGRFSTTAPPGKPSLIFKDRHLGLFSFSVCQSWDCGDKMLQVSGSLDHKENWESWMGLIQSAEILNTTKD